MPRAVKAYVTDDTTRCFARLVAEHEGAKQPRGAEQWGAPTRAPKTFVAVRCGAQHGGRQAKPTNKLVDTLGEGHAG